MQVALKQIEGSRTAAGETIRARRLNWHRLAGITFNFGLWIVIVVGAIELIGHLVKSLFA